MAEKSMLEVVLMPLVLAVVGTVGTYLITQQRQQATDAQAVLGRERADIVAQAGRQVKILELIADKIVSDDEDEQALAIFSTLALDPELAAKLLPTFSIKSENRSVGLREIVRKVTDAIVLARVTPADTSAEIEGKWILHRSDKSGKSSVGSMSIEADELGTFVVTGSDWSGEGKIVGGNGVYDWEFDDRKKGKTRVFLDSSGMLFGWVKGDNINWTYWALKQSGG